MWNIFGQKSEKSGEQDKSALNKVDLCFVVDNTGSMGAFIQAAKQRLVDVMERLSQESGINLHIGIVAYRDHPPQDNTFVTRVHDLTGDLSKAHQAIAAMKADGGGDSAEAVYQGVFDSVHKISWRPNSCRFVVLVGDAPPHGFAVWYNERFKHKALEEGDGWPDRCPSNLDPYIVGAELERKGITLHAICQGKSNGAKMSFSLIAGSSGGKCMNIEGADEVIKRIVEMLQAEFKELEFDRQVLDVVEAHRVLDSEKIGAELGATRLRTAAALARLGKRGFFAHWTEPC